MGRSRPMHEVEPTSFKFSHAGETDGGRCMRISGIDSLCVPHALQNLNTPSYSGKNHMIHMLLRAHSNHVLRGWERSINI